MDEDDNDIIAETANPDTIQPINRSTVHRICSGQVVLSLAIAVKELVENAIDASATSIEVRLKDYGSELLEVVDNGNGVRQENFEALTLKYHTSKLREFSDLESVATLGFRGEALSSLCALSNLTITTRHPSAEYATKIHYDVNGKIKQQLPAAREVGTTVTLDNLFSTLPVRRKEFTKNLKREYSKMCQLLYAYCLVSKGIKFMCTNQTSAGSRSTVVATEGSHSTRDNIITVFGHRQIPSLVEIEMIEATEDILEEYKIKLVPGESLPFKFECFISNAAHGSGRSTTDRQFFYINSRPCEPNKIMKLANQIYRQFNSNQYPFVFLNIDMERSLIDVNVTPDKRQVFLEKEKLLLAVLKSSLLEAFKNCPSTFKLQNVDVKSSSEQERGHKRPREFTKFSSGPVQTSAKNRLMESFQKRAKSDSTIGDDKSLKQSSLVDNDRFNITIEPNDDDLELASLKTQSSEERLDELIILAKEKIESPTSDSKKREMVKKEEILNYDDDDITMTVIDDRVKKSTNKKTVTVRSSFQYIKEAMQSCREKDNDVATLVKFRSQITPTANQKAEQELQKQITKDMFKTMKIIGQFNLGFIIAQLENDLFIIDQHATDEKYNFEQLQLTTVLESQNLVNPKPLELTAANEEILIEHEETFKKNGFKFSIDCNAPATKKISLTAIPISKNYIFGKDDIEEMLFMLQEDINLSVCRPSRVRAMFASRACRKSVMVGCPLSQSDMRRLVDHMGEINQPWNCPHGRPTMRHLINLQLIQNNM